MGKTILLFLLSVIIVSENQAQNKTIEELKKQLDREIKKAAADTVPKIWSKGGLFNVNFGQTTLTNWASGGDEFAMNINSYLNLFAFYDKGRHSWDNSLDLAIGYVRTTSLGTRKADDRIDLLSKYGYEIFKNWYLSALVNLRTQFTEGFNYPGDGDEVKVSDFFSPAYLLGSIGLDLKTNNDFSLFLSPITARLVFVTDDSLSAKGAYGVDTGKTVRTEIGAFLSANYRKDLVKNITYKGKLDLFSNYRNNPKNVDLFMTNLFSLIIFKGFSASLGLDLIYDDDVRIFGPNSDAARMQVRQYIGIGYTANF